MPAYLYKKTNKGGVDLLTQIKKIPLAGYNTIFQIWQKKGMPFNGWHIRRNDMLDYVLKNEVDYDNYEIIIDAAPSVKKLIDLVELHDIYLYTRGNKEDRYVIWSVLMLRVNDAFWKENVSDEKEKISLTKTFPYKKGGEDIFTFLYLHGTERHWNWGRLGQMNGAWISKDARNYFKKLFCSA